MTKHVIALMLFISIGAQLPSVALAQNVERVRRICSDLAPSEKPVVGVMDFDVKTSAATLGGGMATMLMNALHGTGCFDVVETERIDEVISEQVQGKTGMFDEKTTPAVGKMVGAQFLVMGTITEFKENESGGEGSGRQIPGFGRVRSIIGGVKMTTAHVGFTIRIVDATTRRVIVSESFDKKKRDVGLMAATGTWTSMLAGAGFKSKSMADAFEEGLIDAVEFIANQRSAMIQVIPVRVEAPRIEREQCAALQSTKAPKIMVIIPEEHIMGQPGSYGNDRNPYNFKEHQGGERPGAPGLAPGPSVQVIAAQIVRPPDPAGETEIIRKLIEFGFVLVDPKQIQTLREQEAERFRQVHKNPAIAVEIGRQFRADIVITGEAFSEFAKQTSGMYSCRARVETRATDVHSGRIIATEGMHASGADISEFIAGKTALRNAGTQAADYYIPRICSYAAGDGARQGDENTTSPGISRVVINNVDYATGRNIEEAIRKMSIVQSVKKESFLDGKVTLLVQHSGSTDNLADALGRLAGLGIKITGSAGRDIAARVAPR